MAQDPTRDYGFKRPDEIPRDEKMIPVSTRIPESVAKRLAKEAEQSGHPVAKLLAHAICSYVMFLDSKGKE